MSLAEIRKQKEIKTNELTESTGMFFAFSQQQYRENKTPIKQGDKYICLGMGAFIPKSNFLRWDKESDEIEKWYQKEILESGNSENEIIYELHNYECFYTNDISDVVELFKGRYSEKRIKTTYLQEKER